MTAQNREKSSIDWGAVKRIYEGERISIRALARKFNTSDTEVHRRAKSGQWVLFSAKSAPQQHLQQAPKSPMLWDFEPRRAALVDALKRTRNGVDNCEDAIYADFPLIMALLWLRTPFAEIAAAVQMSESKLEDIFGKPILAFVREHHFRQKPKRAGGGRE